MVFPPPFLSKADAGYPIDSGVISGADFVRAEAS
jgi:hypothetical protein